MVMMSSVSVAQNRTNIWELSYSTDLINPNSEIRFHNGIADTNSVFRIMSFFLTDASICDTAGNLLFYTNGITIGNRNYDTLENAVNFNEGEQTTNDDPDGLSACQGAIFLPAPANDNMYYIFYITGLNFFAHNQYETQPLHLSYSKIDLQLDSGNGGIIDSFKNLHLVDDTLTWGRLTACKHANGRDWWLIMHRYYSNKFYKFLITPNGITGPFEQSIGSIVTKDIVGQATFSPDGSKFAMVSPSNILDYLQFDRCTGEFYDSKIIVPPDSMAGISGCSFSPNNRFLYVSSLYNIYQYDTWDTAMETNVIQIAAWDSFEEFGTPVLFFSHQLAPDNKIYISPFNGVSYINLINNPDSLGPACSFTPHSLVLPYFNDEVPSFPNYDLGALEGSPCDTLSIPTQISPPETLNFHLSPNPASSYINIVYSIEQNATLTFANAYGSVVKQLTLYPYFKNRIVYVEELPAGVYLVTLHEGDKMVAKKIVITK